jgi:hypothetical protein
MSVKVEFSTIRYQQVHGRKPRGYGLWYFSLPGGITLSHAGTYGAATRVIAVHARRVCSMPAVLKVQVCA